MEIKVAIVGAEECKWPQAKKPIAKRKIREILLSYLRKGYKVILVSGGCPRGGVDIWAEEIADELGLEKKIFKPKKPTWYWFKKRNIQIAKYCDVLYDIEPLGKKSGGTWTLNYAKQIGKKVFLIEI